MRSRAALREELVLPSPPPLDMSGLVLLEIVQVLPRYVRLLSLLFLSICLRKQEIAHEICTLPHTAAQVTVQEFSHDSTQF